MVKQLQVEAFARQDSPVHQLSVRIKLTALLVLLTLLLFLTPVLTPDARYICFGLYGILLLSTAAVSRISLRFFMTRSALVLPFSALIVLVNFLSGNFTVLQTLDTLIKSLFSVFTLLLFTATSPFNDILRELATWKTPRLLILILAFMYRYFFLLSGEADALRQAIAMRHATLSGWRRIRIYANIIGLLIIRSYERAERVYLAMRMRGFTGEFN